MLIKKNIKEEDAKKYFSGNISLGGKNYALLNPKYISKIPIDSELLKEILTEE